MQAIHVHRYPKATEAERGTWPPDVADVSDHWQGWVEPDDRSWILFVAVDGTVTMFDHRDPVTGAVVD